MNIRLWFFLPFFLFVSCQTPLKSKKWVAKGDLNLKRDLYREAVEYYQKALEHDPDSQDAHFRLGVVLIKVGNYTAALSEYEILITEEPILIFNLSLGVVLIRKPFGCQ